MTKIQNWNLKQAEAAVVVATGMAADLVSRIFLTVLSLFISVNARYFFLCGAISTILLRFGNWIFISLICLNTWNIFLVFYFQNGFQFYLQKLAFLEISDYMGMLIITALLSFVRTWFHLTQPLIFADYLPPER